jgi:hypothetical protein
MTVCAASLCRQMLPFYHLPIFRPHTSFVRVEQLGRELAAWEGRNVCESVVSALTTFPRFTPQP